MAYIIYSTDGTIETARIQDRTKVPVAGIDLLGKNFASYGEIMASNMVHMVENFSNTAAPDKPLPGQLWWDNANNELKVCVVIDNTGNPEWIPIGGRFDGEFSTGFNHKQIKDTNGVWHQAIRILVGGQIVAIISNDTYTPHDDQVDASNNKLKDLCGDADKKINPGLNLNVSTSNTNNDVIYKLRGRAIEAEFADMAEIYQSDVELVPGNIVRLGGEQEITKTVEEFDGEVFGVISTAPGFLLNSKEKLKELAYPVALKGRVPCLVKGTVRKGQRIVASEISGVGMATDKFDPTTIIGRALENKTTDDIGIVEVAVGVR